MPKHLTVVASVISAGMDPLLSHKDLSIRVPEEPLSLVSFATVRSRLTDIQLVQIYVGLVELRRVFSRRLVTALILRFVNADQLGRTDVFRDEDKMRLEKGEALISITTSIDFQGRQQTGRPHARSAEQAFKRALAMAVARIDRLSYLAEQGDADLVTHEREKLGRRLQTVASLFNLNSSHIQSNTFAVRYWCETNGPDFLAADYGLTEHALDAALGEAFRLRLRTHAFAEILEQELGRIETLLAWVAADRSRMDGQASRRDTTRRILAAQNLDWENAPGVVTPPRMGKSVRQHLIAHRHLDQLTPQAMIEAAMLFDLEPAYDTFLTRLYLLPVLAIAGIAGRLGLRRQETVIGHDIAAGGLVALAERDEGSDEMLDTESDEVGKLLELIESVLSRSEIGKDELAAVGGTFFEREEQITIPAPGGTPRFFIDE